MQFLQSTSPFIIWAELASLVLILLRILLAIMFIDGGRRHVADPGGRGKGMGLSATFTFILGVVEVVAGLLVLVGLWIQIAALMLIAVMLGAIYFKVFVWKTGIYGDKNNGWYYDALLLASAGILLTIGGGSISLAVFLNSNL